MKYITSVSENEMEEIVAKKMFAITWPSIRNQVWKFGDKVAIQKGANSQGCELEKAP